MTFRTTQERWAHEAGDWDDPYWCSYCREWVEPDEEKDEDGRVVPVCCLCGKPDLKTAGEMGDVGDWLEDEPEMDEEGDNDLPVG